MSEETSYRRTKSDIPPDVDLDQIRKQAHDEARRSLLLERLDEHMRALTEKVNAIGDAVTDMRQRMQGGDDRMGRIEKDLKVLREDLSDHKREHTQTEKDRAGVWASVLPGIITSVVASVVTAIIIGGILYTRSLTP